jgi:hypothetical protein
MSVSLLKEAARLDAQFAERGARIGRAEFVNYLCRVGRRRPGSEPCAGCFRGRPRQRARRRRSTHSPETWRAQSRRCARPALAVRTRPMSPTQSCGPRWRAAESDPGVEFRCPTRATVRLGSKAEPRSDSESDRLRRGCLADEVSASVRAFEDRPDLIRSVCLLLIGGAHRDVVGRSATTTYR